MDASHSLSMPYNGAMSRYRFIATYIMVNRKQGAIYTGVTSNLIARIGQHKDGKGSRFTAKYNCHKLAWYQRYPQMAGALEMEARIKGWKRMKKIALIEEANPDWRDLSSELSEDGW